MLQPVSIISELEEAVRSGSSEQRVGKLRQVTDLFLQTGDRLTEEQIHVFDEVLLHLTVRIESRILADLSGRLAPLHNSPNKLIHRLAEHDEIAVAGPVLTNSPLLSSATLAQIAKTKSQDHLFAISGRDDLTALVTDVLVERGERKVIRRLAANTSANFSDEGYTGMVEHAASDDEIAELLGARVDLPNRYLRDLLLRATDAVRKHLLAVMPGAVQDEIRRVLETIESKADTLSASKPTRDFSRAEAAVRRMKGLNELTSAAIDTFAKQNKLDEVAAALGLLNNSAPTELMARVLDNPRADLVLIPCKGAGLEWSAVETILKNRTGAGLNGSNEAILVVARQDYLRLSKDTAVRTLRFWQLHDKLEK